mmetsp:Transcript_3004/g.6858  ORF Transcript_3004/g.6858 Transcript_3004/m.6858 type:complete len:286 (+) Transcript_3004:899-1756(+)
MAAPPVHPGVLPCPEARLMLAYGRPEGVLKALRRRSPMSFALVRSPSSQAYKSQLNSYADSSPPSTLMVVSKKDTSPFASKCSCALTHSAFFLNSSTSPITASVDIESTMLPPWFSQLCPALVLGISSSVPHANFLYPSHECINMALTAACLSRSASPFLSDPMSRGLSPSGSAPLIFVPDGSLSLLPPSLSSFLSAGLASAASFFSVFAFSSAFAFSTASLASFLSSSAFCLVMSSCSFNLSCALLAVFRAFVLTSRSAASCSDCEARKTLSASLFFCSTLNAL